MKISTCLSTNPAKFEAVPFKGNFESNVAEIAKMGFDGIELAVRDPLIIDQEKIIGKIFQAGMEIPAIGTGQAWGEEGLSFTANDSEIREQAIERVISHIELSKKAGSVIIIGLLRGVPDPAVPRDTVESWMLEAFTYCAQKAAATDVRMAFEPINRYETSLLNGVREGLEFIAKVGQDNLGMLLDTFHMNIEEPSIEESIALAGDRIFHFHYADSNRWYPGAGHLDFHSILETLYKTGYSGYISGEHRPDPEPVTAARNGLLYMREIEKRLSIR
ncbi:MAG: sugar phosphate isomerase/epimerase [Bacteroidetes bacterium]|nr:sugar phosphate isomerase/epimerase [Bacteroidota bacterium]